MIMIQPHQTFRMGAEQLPVMPAYDSSAGSRIHRRMPL